MSRINLRLSESLKGRIEEAAGQAGLSVNAWLVRAAAAALEGGPAGGRDGGQSGLELRTARPLTRSALQRLGPLTPSGGMSCPLSKPLSRYPSSSSWPSATSASTPATAPTRWSTSAPPMSPTSRTSGPPSRPASSTPPGASWSPRRNRAAAACSASPGPSTSPSSCPRARSCTPTPGRRGSTPPAAWANAGSRPASATLISAKRASSA